MDSVFSLGIGDASRDRVNLDDLYENNRARAMNTLHMFNRVLKRVHTRIKHISRSRTDEQHCWYIMPEMIIGYPGYDCKECTAYVINALRENGFVVKYTHPNLLFISWKSWTPSYVREEIRKKTGISLSAQGVVTQPNKQKPAPPKATKKQGRTITFTDIDNYKPTGKMFS